MFQGVHSRCQLKKHYSPSLLSAERLFQSKLWESNLIVISTDEFSGEVDVVGSAVKFATIIVGTSVAGAAGKLRAWVIVAGSAAETSDWIGTV
jgi:hypothetical protein